MKLLLDTHVLLWWLRDDARLGQRSRALIAAPRNEVKVSIASFWEIAIKARLGKLPETGSLVLREALASGFTVVPVDERHLACMEGLVTAPDHTDPFDHLILAQATVEGAALITGDRRLKAYEVARVPVGSA